MAERKAESTWLYNRPSEGIVQQWLERNSSKSAFTGLEVLDSAVLLANFFQEWNGTLNIKFGPDDTPPFVLDGPTVPHPGTKLWKIWQEYTNSDEGKADRNDPKMHLHRFRVNPHGKLLLRGSEFDWHRMRLGLMLRDGKLPERYRDGFLPIKVGQTYIFKSVHPNNTNSHSVVVTSDDHLVLATRGKAVDYYAGYTAASVEQQTNPGQEHSPFGTYLAAVSKLSSQSELNLTPRPETLRLGAIFLEPDVNCAAFLVVGKVEEDSSQINPSVIGKDRMAEFAPESNSVWTLPLDKPDILIQHFYHPNGYLWHGTTRLRIVAALSYIHGYETALDMLYRGQP